MKRYTSPRRLNAHAPSESKELLANWLCNQGLQIKVAQNFQSESGSRHPLITLGDLQFSGDRLGVGTDPTQGSAVPWASDVAKISESHSLVGVGLVSNLDDAKQMRNTFAVNGNMGAQLGTFIQEHFKVLDDFRVRANLGSRTGVLESMTGADTASVVLNLKNHLSKDQRDRYKEIIGTFAKFYPRFDIEAVEQVSGREIPEVLFYESGKANPLSYTQVSSGMQQVLTLGARAISPLSDGERHIVPIYHRIIAIIVLIARFMTASDNDIRLDGD